MYIYDANIVYQPNGKFHASILRINHDEPGYDTVMEMELSTIEDAEIWVDDELSRLTTGKGIWD
jgi:hypothetical protein